VMKPGGEFLLMIVNVDGWAWFASPHALAHHRAVDPMRWRAWLESSGFDILEQGTQPAALYFLSRKSALGAHHPAALPGTYSSGMRLAFFASH
jgi:hypothetical protein